VKRWAWNIFCLLSLLIFATSVTIWVRSRFFEEDIFWKCNLFVHEGAAGVTKQSCTGVEWANSIISIYREKSEGVWYDPQQAGWHYAKSELPEFPPARVQRPDRLDLEFGGFAFCHQYSANPPSTYSELSVRAPLWLFLLAGIPPFLWWWKWRKIHGRGFEVSMRPVKTSA